MGAPGGFNSDAVANGATYSLLASGTLCLCLDGGVSEEKLNDGLSPALRHQPSDGKAEITVPFAFRLGKVACPRLDRAWLGAGR